MAGKQVGNGMAAQEILCLEGLVPCSLLDSLSSCASLALQVLPSGSPISGVPGALCRKGLFVVE